MSKGNEAIKTIGVAAALCIVCSILVSATVVWLKPQQLKNAEIDYKKNILMSAGLLKPGQDVEEEFNKIETIIVDMETGQKVEMDAINFDQVAASKDPAQNVKIPASEDVGNLSTRSKLAKIFLTRDASGVIETVILNVWGKGLWSTMYGFIALGQDANTVKGFAYYAHGETPGLGGEVGNPKWKKQWIGKKLYNADGEVAFKVAKAQAKGDHEVDGLSGATITGNGVSTSMKYWFGSHGYGKFLEALKAGEI